MNHEEMIQKLLASGYTVTFEAAAGGGYFCLLRSLASMELVNCIIADDIDGALVAALDWDESGFPGNGTGDRLRAHHVEVTVDGEPVSYGPQRLNRTS